MKYFPGDVVEVISSKYKSWKDIVYNNDQHFYEAYGRTPHFVGQRFKIVVVFDNYVSSTQGLNYGHLHDRKENVFLYHRPFINWIKAFFSYFRK